MKKRILWNEKNVIQVMRKCKNRKEFSDKHGGAYCWAKRNRPDLFDKYLPNSRIYWNEKKAVLLMKQCKSRREFGKKYQKKPPFTTFSHYRNSIVLNQANKQSIFQELRGVTASLEAQITGTGEQESLG